MASLSLLGGSSNEGCSAWCCSRVADHSAIEAIDTLAVRYLSKGKTLHLKHLSQECQLLLEKAGDLVEVNVIEDPDYHIATDKLA